MIALVILFLPILVLFGQASSLVFLLAMLGIIPLAALFVLPFFIRMSRIRLQTTAGPVVLAAKMQLTDPSGTLARYQTIKESIEHAMQTGRA